MKKKLLIFSFLIIGLLVACNKEKGNPSSITNNTPKTQSNAQSFKSIPQAIVMEIWNEADLLDYIFHELPFSMSQDQQASIRTNVTYISQEAQMTIPAGCKPIGRQFFAKQGDIFLEADIYFNDQCQFYVFFIDGKPTYANKMAPEGVQFFTSMISQALNAQG